MNALKFFVVITVFIPFFSDAVDKKKIEPKRTAHAANAAVVFSGSAVAAGAGGISGLVFNKFSNKNHTSAQDRLASLQQQDMAAFTSAREAVRTAAQQADASVNSIRLNMQTVHTELQKILGSMFKVPLDQQEELLAKMLDIEKYDYGAIYKFLRPYTSEELGSHLKKSEVGPRLAIFYRNCGGLLERYKKCKPEEATAVTRAAQCNSDLAVEMRKVAPQNDYTKDAQYLTHLKHAERWKYGMYLGIGCGIMVVLAAGLYAVHTYWLNSENTNHSA